LLAVQISTERSGTHPAEVRKSVFS